MRILSWEVSGGGTLTKPDSGSAVLKSRSFESSISNASASVVSRLHKGLVGHQRCDASEVHSFV